MWKIQLNLEHNLVIKLGDVRSGKPGWAECQPPGIVSLLFPFVGAVRDVQEPLSIFMSGMDYYNFFVEASKPIGGNSFSIKGMWFLGKTVDNRVTGFVIGDTCKPINTVFGKEYHGTKTVGWKKGVVGGKVISDLRRGR